MARKITLTLKPISAKHKSKFAALSLVIVTEIPENLLNQRNKQRESMSMTFEKRF
jgi:hypothetical protein